MKFILINVIIDYEEYNYNLINGVLFMAMDRAYTAEYKLIFAREAIKGKKYFCPACNGKLIFCSGDFNAPHFRHSNGTQKELAIACELYSRGLGEDSSYENEIRARQSIRIVLNKMDDIFKFELKFPILNQPLNSISYFQYTVNGIKDLVIHSTHLHTSRRFLNYSVPLNGRYGINCSDEILERKLGISVSGDFEPFKDGPLIFKEIQGEFISIPYRKLHISGIFYVVSYGELLTLNKDILCKVTKKIDKFYIYEFHMPMEINDGIIRWFNVYLNYILQPATCLIDIYEPAIFKKQGTTLTVSKNKTTWVITNLGSKYENQRLIVVYPNSTRKVISIPSNNLVELTFQEYGDYLIYMDQEVSEMINIHYIPEIKSNHKFEYALKLNENDVLFEENKIESEVINLSSLLKVDVHRPNFVSYSLSNCVEQTIYAPARIDISTLWSVSIINSKNLQINQELNLDYLFELYGNGHLFHKELCLIEQIKKIEQIVKFSEFENKLRLLTYIRKFGIKVPCNVAKYIKGYFK